MTFMPHPILFGFMKIQPPEISKDFEGTILFLSKNRRERGKGRSFLNPDNFFFLGAGGSVDPI